jgi:hypothetical protein
MAPVRAEGKGVGVSVSIEIVSSWRFRTHYSCKSSAAGGAERERRGKVLPTTGGAGSKGKGLPVRVKQVSELSATQRRVWGHLFHIRTLL